MELTLKGKTDLKQIIVNMMKCYEGEVQSAKKTDNRGA